MEVESPSIRESRQKAERFNIRRVKNSNEVSNSETKTLHNSRKLIIDQ